MSPAHLTPADERTPITVMVGAPQMIRLELVLTGMRDELGITDENAITDAIFLRGLEALEREMPWLPPASSHDGGTHAEHP